MVIAIIRWPMNRDVAKLCIYLLLNTYLHTNTHSTETYDTQHTRTLHKTHSIALFFWTTNKMFLINFILFSIIIFRLLQLIHNHILLHITIELKKNNKIRPPFKIVPKIYNQWNCIINHHHIIKLPTKKKNKNEKDL